MITIRLIAWQVFTVSALGLVDLQDVYQWVHYVMWKPGIQCLLIFGCHHTILSPFIPRKSVSLHCLYCSMFIVLWASAVANFGSYSWCVVTHRCLKQIPILYNTDGKYVRKGSSKKCYYRYEIHFGSSAVCVLVWTFHEKTNLNTTHNTHKQTLVFSTASCFWWFVFSIEPQETCVCLWLFSVWLLYPPVPQPPAVGTLFT